MSAAGPVYVCVAPKGPAPLRTIWASQPLPSALRRTPPEILLAHLHAGRGAMADYFYACYDFDVPLPSGPRQVETSTTTNPWRARLASWALRPQWSQRLHKSLLAVSVKVFYFKGIISKVDVRQDRTLVDDGLSF